MDKIIGFIGSGNMATAMIGGIVNSKLVSPNKIMASNPTKAKLQELSEKYKINITTNNHEVAKESDILILAVKPQYYPEIIEEIKEDVKKDVIELRYRKLVLGLTYQIPFLIILHLRIS